MVIKYSVRVEIKGDQMMGHIPDVAKHDVY